MINKSLASLDDSLVGYWDMESTYMSGSTLMLKDLSKYGNHGYCYNNTSTLVNCGTIGSGPQFISGNGITGKAINFDGIDDFIKVPTITDDLQFKKQNTVVIKGSTRTLSGTQNFIAKHWPLYIYTLDSNFRVGVVVNNDSWQWLFSSYSINSNQYYSFVSRWNSNTKKLDQFVNENYSSRVYNFSGTLISDTPGSLFIGTDDIQYNRNFLNGNIDELRIYNRALSDSEIQALYNSTK